MILPHIKVAAKADKIREEALPRNFIQSSFHKVHSSM
jgi:hypothetical protein